MNLDIADMVDLDIEYSLLIGQPGANTPGTLFVRNGRVMPEQVGPGPCRRFDAEGLIVSPGYIDLQINGGFGFDLWSDPAAMWSLGQRLPETGTTAFYPTLISPEAKQVARAQAALRERPSDYVGAEPLALHLEGPMLSPSQPGVHRPDALRGATGETIADWNRPAGIGLVTLAPELPGALQVISTLCEAGVVVSAGHSQATSEQAQAGENAGLKLVTHLFNAMAPLHHRNPGLVGHTLTSPTLHASLIADGHHLDPAVMGLAWRLLGPNRLALISDAVAALGSDPGPTVVAGEPAIADENVVRNAAGSLAGTRACLAVGVRNLHHLGGADLVGAIGAATKIPAQIMGLADRGHLNPGARGDIVVLDSELHVAATFCGGHLVFIEPEFEDRLSD